MTEAEWVAADLAALLSHLQGERKYLRTAAGRRRLRLFACACCRFVWSAIESDPVSRGRVETAERFADGRATRLDLDCQAFGHPGSILDGAAPGSPEAHARSAAHAACHPSLTLLAHVTANTAAAARAPMQPPWQAALLRCIVGNPFRPVTFAPEWRSPTAAALADAIYAERAFDRLPVLADALEEAGCDSPDVLAHCRDPGPHARGCWVVDGVLGRGWA